MIGDLEACVVASFRDQMAALLTAPVRVVDLDLAGVGFCDAAGARELLALRDRAAQQQITVVLVAAHRAVRLVLHLFGERAWDPEPHER
ncbi:STAS domain-containing protein [Couchioplanes azureus]|uniref:STAS domain-containing protein n=1 Tax=Couchioplanes caeruleus TaxID=56438 RepID=UPI0016708EDB|nr:STAS domain-containing protein [Couchioplanes caeruleus]